MSVTAPVSRVKIVPIRRAEGVPLRNPIAYWIGGNTVTGDGSAGAVFIDISFGTAFAFSGKCFFNVKHWHFQTSATVAGMYGDVDVNASDISPIPAVANTYYAHINLVGLGTSGQMTAERMFFPRMLFALDKTSYGATIGFTGGPNQNGTIYWVLCGGLILAEELLTTTDLL